MKRMNREAVLTSSPALPRSGYAGYAGDMYSATLTGLRELFSTLTQRSLRQRWAGGLNRVAVGSVRTTSVSL